LTVVESVCNAGQPAVADQALQRDPRGDGFAVNASTMGMAVAGLSSAFSASTSIGGSAFS